MSEPALFSRAIDVSAVPAGGAQWRIEASEEERAALAAAFGLLGVDALAADIAIAPWRGDGFAISGRVTAAIRQSCVVSLVPVEQKIDEPFEVHFVPAGSPLAAPSGKPAREVVVQVGADDPPEVFSGKTIDVGSIVAEHFSLAIDPYPRAPDAELPSTVVEGGPERSESPFAVLAKMKKQGG
jgi:uncharacterized metal-binding protein YceD (DUF177 family)